MSVAGLIYADQRGWLLVRRHDDMAAYHGRAARVSQVVDGDTIDIELPDALHDRPVTRVRLIGIDAPEEAYGGKAAEPLADQATALAREASHGQQVLLWLEPAQPRDAFGRLLAHVELANGERLNEVMLRAGLATAEERWPHTLLTRYAQVELTARRQKAGVWGLDRRE